MKWKTRKPKPIPQSFWKKGESVTVRKFAWIPTACQHGETYWLDYLYFNYTALEDTFVSPGCCVDYEDQMTREIWQLNFIVPWNTK